MSACKRGTLAQHEYMYVSAAETSLRDRVATMYNKVGTVHNGDRVEILEKQRRFFRVRTSGGQEGWVEMRSLVGQDVFDGFQKLAHDNANVPVQARGTTRAELNMHLTPARDGEHLYQLKDGEKLEILQRTTTDKNALQAPKPVAPAKANAPPSKNGAGSNAKAAPPNSAAKATPNPPAAETSKKTPVPASTTATPAKPGKDAEPPPKPIMEDWYLVRDSAGTRRLGPAAHDRPRHPARRGAVRRGPAHHGLLRS